MEELNKLIDTVVQHWPFDSKNYEKFDSLSPAEQDAFKLRHINDHQLKAALKFITILEPHDHQFDMVKHIHSRDDLRMAVRNQFINTLRAAAVLGMFGKDITRAVETWAQEKHKP